MRLVFVKSAAAKETLRPHLMGSNVEKTMAAPVTAIVGYDLAFFEHLPRLFPAYDAKSWFTGNEEFARVSAIRNGTLQGGYLILAARALGLDCGPMSGFDNAGVDAAFFAGTAVKSNFLVNLGYGDPAGLHPRSPRFDFDDMAKIV
jgi:3-hydroxypropanoate dehydrogenase